MIICNDIRVGEGVGMKGKGGGGAGGWATKTKRNETKCQSFETKRSKILGIYERI
jgi:hypothetical protein